MRSLYIVVFALALVWAPTAFATPHSATPPPTVEVISGQGVLGAMVCGACLGSGLAAFSMGWGAMWAAIMDAGDGRLASACVDVCLSAL